MSQQLRLEKLILQRWNVDWTIVETWRLVRHPFVVDGTIKAWRNKNQEKSEQGPRVAMVDWLR